MVQRWRMDDMPAVSLDVRFRGQSGHCISDGVRSPPPRFHNLSFCEHRPERHESLVRHDSEQVTTIPVAR